jgi:hypothetical protein
VCDRLIILNSLIFIFCPNTSTATPVRTQNPQFDRFIAVAGPFQLLSLFSQAGCLPFQQYRHQYVARPNVSDERLESQATLIIDRLHESAPFELLDFANQRKIQPFSDQNDCPKTNSGKQSRGKINYLTGLVQSIKKAAISVLLESCGAVSLTFAITGLRYLRLPTILATVGACRHLIGLLNYS